MALIPLKARAGIVAPHLRGGRCSICFGDPGQSDPICPQQREFKGGQNAVRHTNASRNF